MNNPLDDKSANTRILDKLKSSRFFCETSLFCINKDSEKVPFIWNKAQVHYDNNQTNDDSILKARKMGFSLKIMADWLHACVFFENRRAVIMSHEEGATRRLLERVRYFIATSIIPIKTKKNSESEISFPDTNSTLWIGTAGQKAFGRGDDITDLHLSEYLWYPDLSVITGVREALRNNARTRKESTANGVGNPGYKSWLAAVEGRSNSKAHFYGWFWDDDYRSPDNSPIDDISSDEKKTMDALNLTPAQMRWRRKKLADMDDPDKFPQEYPACLTGDTLVPTNKGIVRLDSIVAGMTTNGNEISAFIPQGDKEVYSVRTKNGRNLECTADHRIGLPSGKFAELRELRPGNDIQLLPVCIDSDQLQTIEFRHLPSVKCSFVIDPEWAKFLGYFMGDGSFYRDTLSIISTAKDGDVVSDAGEMLAKLFGKATTRKHREGAVEHRISNVRIEAVLKAVGALQFVDNKYPYWKRKVCVPECILRSPKHIVKEFLSALFECDGCSYLYTPRVMFFSKYPVFIEQINLLLSGFGINGKVTSVTKKAGDGQLYTGNELALSARNATLFHESIGFISARKKAGKRHSQGGAGRHAVSISGTDTIESISPAGIKPVFDISVVGPHSFSANGILVHNCWQEAFLSTGQNVFAWQDVLRQEESRRLPKIKGEIVDRDGEVEFERDPGRGQLEIYLTPNSPAQHFLVTADAGEGIEGGDGSSGSVWDIDTWEQCAHWYGFIDAMAFGYVLFNLGKYYNWAHICCETNYPGNATAKKLEELSYPKGKLWKDKLTGKPWKTETPNRSTAVTTLREAVRQDTIKINSQRTINEMRTFIRSSVNRLEAEKGCHDDCIIEMAIAAYLLKYHEFEKPRASVAPSPVWLPRSMRGHGGSK